jgi:protein involved in polysaccharide export with SLBB domain
MANYRGTETFLGTIDISGATLTALQSQLSPGLAVAPAADAACAILNTTAEINLTVTGAGNVAISTTSSYANQVIYLRAMAVAGGGSYTLVVTGGTLTLNSTGEAAIIKRNVANNAWLVYSLCASSSTGANIATIV